MTDKCAPNNFLQYQNYECWAITNLMEEDSEFLTGFESDMRRSKNRLKTKLPADRPGHYSGPSVTSFAEYSMVQKFSIINYFVFYTVMHVRVYYC